MECNPEYTMETYCGNCKNILRMKIQILEKLSKID